MSLESATWISELDPTNPPGTDLKKQGDDHIRMIKSALKANFPNASKAFYFPTTAGKTAGWSVVASEQNKTFYIQTNLGALTVTLPALTIDDAGWECHFIKVTSDTNAYFIRAAVGNVNSGDQNVTQCRRSVPGVRISAYWSGAAWYISRSTDVPIGTVLDVPRASLPTGYVYAAGQTLANAATDYPEWYKANGNSSVVTDRRGRAAFGRDNMNGSAAGRLGNTGGETGQNTLGSGIGGETIVLTQARLPACFFTLSVSITDPGHNHVLTDPGHVHIMATSTIYAGAAADAAGSVGGSNVRGSINLAGQNTAESTTGITLSGASTGISASGSADSGGSNQPFSRVPPGIITDFMVVIE